MIKVIENIVLFTSLSVAAIASTITFTVMMGVVIFILNKIGSFALSALFAYITS